MPSIDTVNDLPPRVQYVALAAQTAFDYPFPIFEDADLVVNVDGVDLSLTNDYTVSGAGDDTGGTVTLVDALYGDEIVTIYRDIAIARDTDVDQNGPWRSAVYNDEQDKIFLILQQLESRLGRAFRLPIISEAPDSDMEFDAATWANMYLGFDADGVPTPTALSATAITQAIVGQLLFPRTAAEIAAGVVPTYFAYEPADARGDMARYGAAGDWNGVSGTDDTQALRNACLVIQAQGGGVLNLGSARYKVNMAGVAVTGGTPISQFEDLRGARIKSNGAEICNVATFTGVEFVEGFSFRDCSDVVVEPIKFSCPSAQPAGQAASRGFECLKFWDGCKNVVIESIEAVNCRAAVTFRRNSTGDPKARNITIGSIETTDTGYGLNCILSGDNLTAKIRAVRPVRIYYPYGVDTHKVVMVSQDHTGNADCNVSSATGEGCQNLDLDYTNISSTVADNSITCVKLSFTDQTPAVHRNIRVKLNIKGTVSAYLGYGFIVEKLTNAGAPDGTDRGHTLENIEVSGSIIGLHASHRTIAVCGIGTWGPGEYVRNIRLKNLRLDAAGQPLVVLTSLKDTAVLDNVYAQTAIDMTGNTTSRILVLGGSAPNFTTSTADTANVTYIGTSITDGTTQSKINKQFVGSSALSSYTATLTGCTTSPTATFKYNINGDIVTLEIVALSATSNTNACTATGAPVVIRPISNQVCLARYTDNGTDAVGLVRVGTDGTLTLFNAASSATFFTSSGTKGFQGCTITYRLNG